MQKRRLLKLSSLALVLVLLTTTVAWYLLRSAPVDHQQQLSDLLTRDGIRAKPLFDMLYQDIANQQQAPGAGSDWQLSRIQLIENKLFYYLDARHAKLSALNIWAQSQDYLLRVDHQGTALLRGVRSQPPLQEVVLMDMSDLSAYLHDALHFALPGMQLRFGEDLDRQLYRARPLAIHLQQAAWQDLLDLGLVLEQLPLSFLDGEINVSATQGLSGQLNFLLIGDAP